MKKTKILATLGPVSSDVNTIRKMMNTGMDAVRINASHSNLKEFEEKISTVRKASDLPIMLDTQGPEIRLICRYEQAVKKGDVISLGFRDSPLMFSKDLSSKLRKNMVVLVDEGIMRFHVIGVSRKEARLRSLDSGILKNRIRVNIPEINSLHDILSKEDYGFIRSAMAREIDYIALSYTRNRNDVEKVKRLVRGQIKIVSKIENKDGISNFDEILEESDGIMVARGDLGVEIPSEKLPIVQKEMIKKCNQKGKLVITATQMLQSMIGNSAPTRAETSDVANAILDGTDVIMLSAETAVGKYPVESVKEMRKIALETEPYVKNNVKIEAVTSVSEGISHSIYEMTKILPITKVITLTKTGYTAHILSRFRLNMNIIAAAPSEKVRRQLELYYGVIPIVFEELPTRERIQKFCRLLLRRRMISRDDLLLFTGGVFSSETGSTNLIEVHRVADLLGR